MRRPRPSPRSPLFLRLGVVAALFFAVVTVFVALSVLATKIDTESRYLLDSSPVAETMDFWRVGIPAAVIIVVTGLLAGWIAYGIGAHRRWVRPMAVAWWVVAALSWPVSRVLFGGHSYAAEGGLAARVLEISLGTPSWWTTAFAGIGLLVTIWYFYLKRDVAGYFRSPATH